jgi:hypothetical protein
MLFLHSGYAKFVTLKLMVDNIQIILYSCMIKDWNKADICNEIRKITWAGTDPKMDGFVTWGCKQDLYEVLWFVEDELDKMSTYAGEEEFVKRREQNKLLKALGKK